MAEAEMPADSDASAAPGGDTHPPLSLFDAAVYFLVGALLDIVIGLPRLGDVLHGSLLNPDSYMRIVRLREILAQHRLVYVVARDNSGNGTVLAWSHLLDGLILTLAAPLGLFMSEAQAVEWVAIALGPISVGLLCAALVWAVSPIADRQWRWTAPVLAATSLFVAGYGLPGVVHHHVLIAFTIVMSAGWAGRAGYQGATAGWHMGLWSAVGLWLTPETMPFTLLAYGAVGLAWLWRADQRNYGMALRGAGNGFLLLIATALAIDPPYGGYGDAEVDRLSLVYLVLAAAVCAIGWTLWQLDRLGLSPARRRALGLLAGLCAIGAWIASFPGVVKGPSGLMDAARAQAFFGILSEMQPISTLHDAWADLLDGALAILVAAAIAIRARSPVWAYGALAGVLMLALGASHLRFVTYSIAFAAAMLPVAATYCDRLFERRAAILRLALLAAFFIGPRAADALGGSAPPAVAAGAAPLGDCRTQAAVGMLRPYAGKIVMADINDTPELLYRTGVLTVGSAYLPDVASFMRLRDAWRSPPSTDVPETVRTTHAALLLFCPGAGRSRLVADLPPATLWDRLNRNDVPRWLVKLAEEKSSGYALYRLAD
jgi:hypothetical protein